MKQKIAFEIREANEVDAPIVMDLAQQLAVYKRSSDSFVASLENYRK